MVLSNILFDEQCKHFEDITRPGSDDYIPSRASINKKKVIIGEDGSVTSPPQENKESSLIVPHVLKELTDSRGRTLKVGIIGMFGPNAAQFSAAYRKCIHFDSIKRKRSRKAWRDYVSKTKQVANDLRKKYNAHIIIMLAHSGEPEDNNLMTAIHKGEKKPIVDVHISSHTHHIYLIKKKVKGQNVYVHQAGPFATNLGVLQFEFDYTKGHITNLLNEQVPIKDHYYPAALSVPNQLYPIRLPITSDLQKDPEYDSLINKYRDMVDESFLQNVNFKYSSVIGEMPTNWTNKYQLAQYVNDCLLNETNAELMASNYDPIHVFIVALGAVRTEVPSLRASNVTGGPVTFQFSDAYRMLGIGYLTPEVSNTVLPGDPVSHFYIHRREFHAFVTAARLLAQLAPVKDRYTLSFSSSLDYKENKWGIPLLNNRFGKVYDLQINHVDYDHLPEFIHIGMPGWLTRFFSEIGEHTFGLINIYFRDRQGRRLQNAIRSDLRDYILFSKCIMKHTERGDLKESAHHAKLNVEQQYPEASSAEKTSLSDAAMAAATPEAAPEDVIDAALDDIQMTLLNQ
ncbi:5NTD [Acrasis kona]|uniref:5NTD n=1 Tax=Acrasis kona TaxID=1008807 RepID=A0AAW2Z4I3_9EUKA